MSNMVVNTNVLALNSHRNLGKVGTRQSTASQRLSSGMRINSAADDAAGLAISEKMRAQIRGLDQASKNTQDATSLIQTAEGGMQEIDNMVQRIRELVVQASNDTNENTTGTGDRQKVQDEIDQLVEEIDSMSERVEFNNKKLLNGTYGTGKAANTPSVETVENNITDITSELDSLITNAETEIGTLDGTVKTDLDGAITELKAAKTAMGNLEATSSKADVDAAIKLVNDAKSKLTTGIDAYNAKATEDGDTLISKDGDISKLSSAIGEKGSVTKASAKLSEQVESLANVKDEADVDSMYFQIGANSDQGISVNIEAMNAKTLGLKGADNKSAINVLEDTGENIQGQLDKLDDALSFVTTERSKMGAIQNRLEYTQNSLDISSENLSAAESRVRDTDMAKEMMELTQANVLQQAATSMLAQANQAPQNVLQLLQ